MKVWNYIVIFTTLAIFMTLAGFPVAGFDSILTALGVSINEAGDVVTNSNNALRTLVLAALATAVAAAVTIGFFTKSSTENYVILPLIIGGAGILLFVGVGYSIITQAFIYGPQWAGYLTLLIFGPLEAGFLIAIYEHFRGTD